MSDVGRLTGGDLQRVIFCKSVNFENYVKTANLLIFHKEKYNICMQQEGISEQRSMGLGDKRANESPEIVTETEFPEQLRAEVEEIKKSENINSRNVFTFQDEVLHISGIP